MKGCTICNVKHQSFYVSSEELYLCPRHKKIMTEEDEEASQDFKKNRFIIKGKVAEMSIYNKQYDEKFHKVLIDTEDVALIEMFRWTEETTSGEGGHIITVIRKNGRRLSLKLMDYLQYLRYGIQSPSYLTNCNPFDCRKFNIRVKKDKRRARSTIKNLL